MSFYENFVSRGQTALRERIQRRFYTSIFKKSKMMQLNGLTLLEIGPGKGLVANMMTDFGAEYFAVEGNGSLARILVDTTTQNIVQSIVPPIPFASESFDLVFHSHVLEHMEGPKGAYTFTLECARILVTGGRLAFFVPDYSRMGLYYWDSDYTHDFIVTARRLQQLLIDCNLRVDILEKVTEPLPGAFGNIVGSLMRFYPYNLIVSIMPTKSLKSLAYKARSTFSQSLFVVATKV